MKRTYKHSNGITIAPCNPKVACPVFSKSCHRWLSGKTRVGIGVSMVGNDHKCGGCFGANCASRFKAVGGAWYRNRILGHKAMKNAISAYINKVKTVPYFRINGVGDIESINEYVAWELLAKEFPDTIFYGYTKSYCVPGAALRPENLVIHHSDVINYGTLSEVMEYLRTSPGFICPKTLVPKRPDSSSAITCMGSIKGSQACYICASPLMTPIYFVGHGGGFNKKK